MNVILYTVNVNEWKRETYLALENLWIFILY